MKALRDPHVQECVLVAIALMNVIAILGIVLFQAVPDDALKISLIMNVLAIPVSAVFYLATR